MLKSRLIGLSLLLTAVSANAYGQSALFQNQKGADIDFTAQITTQKTLKLDDPFLVQLFARWKALGALAPQTNDLFDLIFSGERKQALKLLGQHNDAKISELKVPMEMYLLYREGHFQSFLALWIEHAANSQFLDSELGLAFDQLAGPGFSLLVMNSGFHITDEVSKHLSKMSESESRLNYTLQAFKALHSGKDAVKWIGKLAPNDELRILLAQSAVLAYAREGQLGASGKLISQVIEPWMQKEDDLEKVALYYLTLGRLLYQAKAFDQAEHFYYLIPESSSYFVKARAEILWSHLQRRDFSNAKGQLATLRLSVFQEKFYPEIFLVQAIGNTMLCEFTAAKDSIQNFIEVNKTWAKRIDAALKSDSTEVVLENDYAQFLRSQLTSLKQEKMALEALELNRYTSTLSGLELKAQNALDRLAKDQWRNRQQILEAAIYKMKFVRVELLSRMRAFNEGLAQNLSQQDQVHTYQAARAKKNQIVFPSDGVVWSDELFNMSAEVKNLCLQGKL